MATKDFWSQNDSYFNPSYYRFPPVIDRYSQKAFNEKADGRYDWLEYFLAKKRFKNQSPFSSVLSLCCGFGHVHLLSLLIVKFEKVFIFW